MSTAERIKQARENAGLSGRQLARLVGCSHAALLGWEKGRHRPTDLAIERIASYCDCSVAWLTEGRLTPVGECTLRQLQRLSTDEREKVLTLLQTLPTKDTP